jgi:GR25 family glycosyltransferase involved in LPS biosynthesis
VPAFNPRDIEWWVINLASRPDRLEHAREQFAKHALDVRRFEGFLPDEWPGKESDVAQMRARTPGAIGCYQSQTHVVRTVQGSDRVVGVFEDDVVLCEDFNERLEWIAEHFTREWDIFYLGATFHVPGEWYKKPDCSSWAELQRDANKTADKHVMRVYGQWGTYAYLVNGRNAKKVLDALAGNMHRSDGIDHNFIQLGPSINAYCFVPGCAWQYDNQSNIGTGVTEFSGFKRLGPYVWTERMEEFDPDAFDWQDAS